MNALILLLLISCGTLKDSPTRELPEWSGKSREEVIAAFSYLTPRTEEDRINYHDSDPIPTPARCSVVPCSPLVGKRIDCRYVFTFKDDRVVKATQSGNCRCSRD